MIEDIPDKPEKRECFTEEDFKREKLINDLKLFYIQKKITEFLLNQQGYHPQDIETNKEFLISLENKNFKAYADLIIRIGGKMFIFVKCVSNSPDSWERYSVAFCRIADLHQIPYAFITDGQTATMLNILDGSVTEGDINIMPSKSEAEKISKKMAFYSYPEDKKEREKRIVYAFEGI